MRSYDAGSKIGNYQVTRNEPLSDIAARFIELVHEPTGARHIHIETSDDNSAFAVTFPTVPRDSKGVAHILEHLVLTGSKRYPVKDPFFAMKPRSLQTFLNAHTTGDHTTYLFSTRSKKDFFNLLSVYLDAVFFPLLDELRFKQEGHRFEFEVPGDIESKLGLKGVVFNEMKANTATQPIVMFKSLGDALYPDLTYSNNSGGDPAAIPDLTWEELREFHAVHYHPSNSYAFTYGNLELSEILEHVEMNALKEFEKLTVDFSIPSQPDFPEPRVFETRYPLSKEEDPANSAEVAVCWKTANIGDSFELLALEVLGEILLGNPAAPLYKSLLQSGLGDSLSTVSGLFSNFQEASFGAGLKKVNPDKAQEVEKVVLGTLEDLVAAGIDAEIVDAAIHQLEVAQREVTNIPLPYGLRLQGRLAGVFCSGADAYRALQLDEDIHRIEDKRKEGNYFEGLIKKWLLDNNHRVRIVLRGDQGLEEEREGEEAKRVEAVAARLSKEERMNIDKDAARLKESQEAEEDLSCLPTMALTDVPRKFEDVEHTIEEIASARVGFFPQPTNGFTYVDVRFDTSRVDDSLKDYLALFAYAAPKMGAGDLGYEEMARRVEASTGGIAMSPTVRPLSGDHNAFLERLTITGKALARNNMPFVEILRDFITSTRFEPRRLKEILAELTAQTEQMVVFQGFAFALLLATAQLSASSMMQERLTGLTKLNKLKNFMSTDISEVIARLEDLRAAALTGAQEICVTSEPSSFDEIRSKLGEFLPLIPPGDAEPQMPPSRGKVVHQARTTAVPVAYNARAHSTVGFNHPDAPALMVLGNYLEANYLLREIRQKGGAYGAYSGFNRESGLFYFASYRDPNVARTFEVFEAAVGEAIKGDLPRARIEEAIIDTCGSVDPLLSPDTKGRVRFFSDIAGFTLDAQKSFKESLLATTEEDLRRVAEAHLSIEGAALASIASPEAIEQANKDMGNVFAVSPI